MGLNMKQAFLSIFPWMLFIFTFRKDLTEVKLQNKNGSRNNLYILFFLEHLEN